MAKVQVICFHRCWSPKVDILRSRDHLEMSNVVGRGMGSNDVIIFSSNDILDTIGREQVTAGNFIGPTINGFI